jgi:hypothetical protein
MQTMAIEQAQVRDLLFVSTFAQFSSISGQPRRRLGFSHFNAVSAPGTAAPGSRQGAKPRPSLLGMSSNFSVSSNASGGSAGASGPSSLQVCANYKAHFAVAWPCSTSRLLPLEFYFLTRLSEFSTAITIARLGHVTCQHSAKQQQH